VGEEHGMIRKTADMKKEEGRAWSDKIIVCFRNIKD
jgi:hypothetical protein